jgi:acetyl esterase
VDGPLTPRERLLARAQGAVAGTLTSLPPRALRLLAGRPTVVDGQELEPEVQLLLRLMALNRPRELNTLTPEQARRRVRADALGVEGRRAWMASIREVRINSDGHGLTARLYVPMGAPPIGPLLVYFHGGGFVVCDLETHDRPCRFLAHAAGVRVLSVDYRLAPEHPFPAAPDDAWVAFQAAAENADELGADPARLAVGGDSAGGNLAAGVAQRAVGTGVEPACQLLIYPWLDLSRRRPSYALFGEGYYLTTEDLAWYRGRYLSAPAQVEDPRCSPLLADDLSGVAPAYIATAGFDPLRDDGEEYAARLREAGVAAALSRHEGLIHGFANALRIGREGREALAQAAGALRYALTPRSP